jgi:excisionase family DNA binding protein
VYKRNGVQAPNQKPHTEPTPDFVQAPAIARRLSVTPRYILQLAEQGRIPCVRLGRKCVRFNPAAVATALGIDWED